MPEPVVDKVVQQMEILDLTGPGHMDPRTGASVEIAADGHVVVVHIGNGQIRPDHVVDLLFQLRNVEIGRRILETDGKTVAHIIMIAPGKLIYRHAEFAQILSRMGHQPIGEGSVHCIPNLLRLRPENCWPGDHYLFTHADEQVGIKAQEGEDTS